MFEYIHRNHSEINPIWITREKQVINQVRAKGYKCYYVYSLKGIYFLIFAKVFLYCQSFNSDFTRFAYSNRSIKVNLWHGTPTKRIGKDKKKEKKDLRLISILNRLYDLLLKSFPYGNEPLNYIISSGKEVSQILKSAFGEKLIDIWETGYPRLDKIVSEDNIKKGSINNIIYMPTYRKNYQDEVKLFNGFIVSEIEKELIDLNSQLTIRLHPASKLFDWDFLKKISKSQLITIDQSIDVYENLAQYNILITDFSSVYFDYLHTGQPIIFAPFNLKEYLINDRDLSFNYNDVSPGPICNNWSEIISWVKKLTYNPNQFKRERLDLKNRIFPVSNRNSCKDITYKINEIIHNER